MNLMRKKVDDSVTEQLTRAEARRRFDQEEPGPGLSQRQAIRIARQIGGVSVGARLTKRGWVWGGYSPHPHNIVITIDYKKVMHDGIDRRTGEYVAREEDDPL